jgi:hypothetical protein
VSWQVSNGLGNVDSTGLLTATLAGTGTITATQPGTTVSDTTGLTVTNVTLTSIVVTPPTSSIAKGSAVPLTATCNYSSGPPHICTTQVNWTSSAPGTATVESKSDLNPGLVHGMAAGGPVTITATLGTATPGTATVTVTAATVTGIVVTPADQIVPSGTNNVHYTATAHFSDGSTNDVTAIANWTVIPSDNSIVLVKTNQGQSNGEVSAKKPGAATITATVPSLGNASGFTTITVT